MAVVRSFYQDPLAPVLFSSPAVSVTQEQSNLIKEVLDICCSDSRFAEKAYLAITKILTGGSVIPPVVSGITPSEATLGDPAFTLHVNGTGFSATDLIVWNGSTEPTTFISATELTTEVDMTTAEVAIDIPVAVVTVDGVMSNMQTFSLKSVAVQSASVQKEIQGPKATKKEVKNAD